MSGLFDPASYSCFRFVSYDFNEATGIVGLDYALDDAVRFRETITVPGAPFDLDATRHHAVGRLLWLLHLVAGTSYYKAAATPSVVVETGALPGDVAALLGELYREGLAEFAWNNGLDLSALSFGRGDPVPADVDQNEPGPSTGAGNLRGPGDVATPAAASPVGLNDVSLVPIGGGKDSVVSIEALRRAGKPTVLFSAGDAEPIRRSAAVAALPWLIAHRELSPNLTEINRHGAYNGHVPVTATISLIASITAVLHGYGHVVMSNERSASVGSDLGNGVIVNHQYSKGLRFEQRLHQILHEQVAADLNYFSLLRPLSEIAIARVFATLPRYWVAITSCNKAFRQDPARRSQQWCGNCAKCRFVFLALAPFMTRDDLHQLVGHRLLDDLTQADGYRELLGLGGAKPFECVGEIEESRAAFAALTTMPQWGNTAVVTALGAAVVGGQPPPLPLSEVLRPVSAHCVPASHRSALDAIA